MDNLNINELVQVVYNLNRLNYERQKIEGFEMDLGTFLGRVEGLKGRNIAMLYIAHKFIGYVDVEDDIHGWLCQQLYFELENYSDGIIEEITFSELGEGELDVEEFIYLDLGYGVESDELQIIRL